MKAHFFDLDILIQVKSLVWIVSKTKPNIPIIKITQSEFNLIKSGIYRKYNSSLVISNTNYYLPENLLNEIKIKCKKLNYDITELVFSMQEFMNPEIIQTLDQKVLIQNIEHLKNSNDDIYVMCSKNTKANYDNIIQKLENKLFDIGLNVKNYYFLSETFYNRNSDDIAHKKIRLILQHLVGFKTQNDKFINEEIQKYEEINFYDDELKSINLAKDINSVFKFILSNTDDDLSKSIREMINNSKNLLFVNLVTHNGVMPFSISEIILKTGEIFKTFESFKNNLYKKY